MESTSDSSQNECGSVGEFFECCWCGELKPLSLLETNCDVCLYEPGVEVCKSCHEDPDL